MHWREDSKLLMRTLLTACMDGLVYCCDSETPCRTRRFSDSKLDLETCSVRFFLSVFPSNCSSLTLITDYLLSHPSTQASSVPIIPLPTLWNVLMDSLAPIWPSTRTQIDGISIGDAWPCSVMPSHPTHPWENIVPFHKLTQWLTYSLMVPMTKLLHVHFAGADLLTGLPEYRNGGLFVDTGLLTLKSEDAKRGLAQYQRNAQVKGQPNMEVVPLFTADDDVIVEWRAVTVGFLDELLVEVNSLLGLSGRDKLNLAQMLEAGSWKVSIATLDHNISDKAPGRTRNCRGVTA